MTTPPTDPAAPDGPLCMPVAELNDFLEQAFGGDRPYEVVALAPGSAWLSLPVEHIQLRPGGTVSGPTLMMLADAAAYAVILAHIGPVALAVTSSLTINFLRKPEPRGIEAEASVLKLGRTLAVVEVRLRSEGAPHLLATAVATYAIPSHPDPT